MKRFIWVTIAGVILLTGLGNFFYQAYCLRDELNKTRDRLMLVASNAAVSINAEELLKVPLQQKGEDSPEYQAIYQKLQKIKRANPFVKYVYILTVTDQPGILQYMVDADPLPQIITARSPTSFPGDKYDASQNFEMISAYNGPSADKNIIVDAWGAAISGYAPVRDTLGKSVAILGVDADASHLQALQKNVKTGAKIALFTGVAFLISLVTLLK